MTELHGLRSETDLVSDCVHCGFCLPTCPTYRLWGEEADSPRGRILLMAARLDGTVELTDTVVERFDRCLGCMACLTACPSGVQYDALIELTREHVEQEHRRSLSERLLRTAIFQTFPNPRRLRVALALAPLSRVLPLPGTFRPLVQLAPAFRNRDAPAPVTQARGERVARVGLLLGCVQREVFGDVNTATARVLAADGFEVVAPAQGCCGALAIHAGRREDGRARARTLIETFERAGVDLVITNAAGCGSSIKEYGRLLGDDPEPGPSARRRSPRRCATSPRCSPSGVRRPSGIRWRSRSRSRTPATSCMPRACGARRAPCCPRFPGSTCASRPIRRSAAAVPASTTWCSPSRQPSSALPRRRRCWRRAPSPTPAPTRGA